MTVRQISWIEHIRVLQDTLKKSSSPFVEQFRQRLDASIEQFLKEQSTLPFSSLRETSAQKALVHALQLYDGPSLLKLIANYDFSQESQKAVQGALKKGLHSLRVIPGLENLTATPMEGEALHAYATNLRNHLSQVLSYPIDPLPHNETFNQIFKEFLKQNEFDLSVTKLFQKNRLDLLFSPEYRTYLILKNRYFLGHLLREAEDFDLLKWLHQILDQIEVASSTDLTVRLTNVNFRTMEYLIQLMNRQLSLKVNVQEESHSPLLQDLISDEEQTLIQESNPLDSRSIVIQKLRAIENVPIAPPLARESKNDRSPASAPAPAEILKRSPFEQLCLKYLKELLYLANQTELVSECSAPYFLPKMEEYISDKHDFFENFFAPHPEILEEFNGFATQLLEKTAHANPFSIQKEEIGVYSWSEGEWHQKESQTRDREWIVMLKSQLPFPMTLKTQKRTHSENSRIEKGRPFIIQFGKTYFDYNLPKPRWIQTRPTSYFKVLLKGTHLASDSAVIYAGNDPFYKLTDPQLWQWRGLILLFLIVARNKYSADLSDPLKDYLVRTIPSLLKDENGFYSN
ncbi:MAG: hypothetical protein HQM13_00250 [SAR324 cluster bacterium]|nr:hypothetical protein [SAR324 cluster bacterium]